MENRTWNVLIALAVVLGLFAVVMFAFSRQIGALNFQVEQATVGLRFLFVVLGVLIALVVYFFSRDNKAWVVGTREVVWMAIGAALFAVFSWVFNGTVFVVPSLSQVALRPAIAIPMFFGYAFGPVVGFFTGAVGNMFGDALTGFGLSPQWSIGNGLIGFISGLWMLFRDRKQSMNVVLWVGGILAVLTGVIFFLNQNLNNLNYYNPVTDTFGETRISLLAGVSILVGLLLVVAVRVFFGGNEDVAAAVTWGMLGNIVGLLFASISDIWINGYSPVAAIVGEFLPAAGPNLIFAAILVPLLVLAYAAVRRQSGR
ncbi:MAG TPA: ECF transporter S component [Anaerolineales bacterium]